jgi:Tol biopolymer transport system component
VATLILPGETAHRHVLFTDGREDLEIIGRDFILDNGHCTFSPDGRWLATDRTHDDSRSGSLWLYDMKLDAGMILLQKPVNEYKYLHGNTRCDFHPRWNPSGTKICFDAIDPASYSRQLHQVEFLTD